MTLAIRRRWILRLFWGERDSYPVYVRAHVSLWWKWFWEHHGGAHPQTCMCRRNRLWAK